MKTERLKEKKVFKDEELRREKLNKEIEHILDGRESRNDYYSICLSFEEKERPLNIKTLKKYFWPILS